MPRSSALRIRRPAACFVSNTAAGDIAPPGGVVATARSQERGSVGFEKGSFGITTPFNVAPGASNPSQKLFRAKRDKCSSARKSSRSPFTDTPHFWHTTRKSSLPSELCCTSSEAIFHFAAIREQGKHRPVLGTVSVDEQALQGAEITRIVGFGHIVDDIDNHSLSGSWCASSSSSANGKSCSFSPVAWESRRSRRQQSAWPTHRPPNGCARTLSQFSASPHRHEQRLLVCLRAIRLCFAAYTAGNCDDDVLDDFLHLHGNRGDSR